MKKWKKAFCGVLAASFMLPAVAMGNGSSAEAASGNWKHNSKGWWYSYSDGSYAESEWVQIEGKWYYFEATGYMATGWRKLDGKWYYFGTNGIMVNGWKKIGESWYFFVGGAMQTGWKKLYGTWYYFEKSGAMADGWKKIDGSWYFFDNGAMKTGWLQDNEKWYFLNPNGTMVTGERTIKGVIYTFDQSGAWTGSAVEEDLPTKLKKLDGVISVEEVNNLSTFTTERYLLTFEQPLDWSDPSKGTFPQRVLLGVQEGASVNVLETYGYSLMDKVYNNPLVLCIDGMVSDLAQNLGGNMILVESRFSGDSRPEDMTNDDTNYWEYLTAENAANDYHKIYQSLSKVLGNVWAATGTSRGGLNTNVYAYYYPEDMKVYVPYVAPCADGMDDDRMYKFVYTEIGNSAFGEEAAAQMRKTVTAFQVELMRKKDRLLPKLEEYIEQNGLIYREGVSTEMIYDLMTLECSIVLWQYRAISFEQISEAVNMPESSNEELDAKLSKLFEYVTTIQDPKDWSTTSMGWPYYVNTATTYGQYRYDFSYLRAALQEKELEGKLTITEAMEEDLIRNIVFTEEQKAAFTYDGSFFTALSASMDTTQAKHIMIYGGADPWYSMRIRETENPNVEVYVHPTNNHMTTIASFPDDVKNEIMETLEDCLAAE